jgi:hypothetical protein
MNTIPYNLVFVNTFVQQISKNGAYRYGCLRRFGRPDKQMRSICRVDKIRRRFCAGMNVADDLAKP